VEAHFHRITITILAIFLPILLSLPRFIPSTTTSRAWSKLKSIFIYPAAFSKHHREPVAGALIPTRGQIMYIFLLSLLNLILLVAPYTITQPQSSFTSRSRQLLSIIGNRAGQMAMGNVVALFLFSSRNSILLYLTDWSHNTYLLLHRWLGYWAVLHTVIHSAMLWSYYVKVGTYSSEFLRLYWIWGIVGTVAMCAIVPFSLPIIRKLFYEFFLVSHVALSLLFLVGYYYHIWYVYTYNWGYEIWMFVAAGIWAVERLVRVCRMVVRGSSTAIVTVIPDTDEEYIKIEIEGKDLKGGVAYLCFPTLSWRFWETHPFSVSGSIPHHQQDLTHSGSNSSSDLTPDTDTNPEKRASVFVTPSSTVITTEPHDPHPSTIFYARTRSGITKTLTNKAFGSDTKQMRLRVLIEGPYNHSGRIHSQLAQCSGILCIAGGVGITACLPLLKQNKSKEIKLFWSSRKAGLVAELRPTLNAFPENVEVETLVGQRFDVDSIIMRELVDCEERSKGALAVVVSGPPGLADDVRQMVTRTVRSSKRSRPYLLVDEAFNW